MEGDYDAFNLSRPAFQNTLERDATRVDDVYARRIPHVYMLSLKWPKQVI